MLFILTRHGVWDYFDQIDFGDGVIPDFYKERKKAIINILQKYTD